MVKVAVESDCYSALEFIYDSDMTRRFREDVDQAIIEQSEKDPLIPFIFSLRSQDYMLGFILRNPSAKEIMPPELWKALMYSDFVSINKIVANEIKKDPLAVLSKIGDIYDISSFCLDECKDSLPKECIDYLDDMNSTDKRTTYFRLITDYEKKKKTQTI